MKLNPYLCCITSKIRTWMINTLNGKKCNKNIFIFLKIKKIKILSIPFNINRLMRGINHNKIYTLTTCKTTYISYIFLNRYIRYNLKIKKNFIMKKSRI